MIRSLVNSVRAWWNPDEVRRRRAVWQEIRNRMDGIHVEERGTMEVFCFPNGSVAVTENGERVPALQTSWLMLLGEFLHRRGANMTEIEVHLPDGRSARFVTNAVGAPINWRVD